MGGMYLCYNHGYGSRKRSLRSHKLRGLLGSLGRVLAPISALWHSQVKQASVDLRHFWGWDRWNVFAIVFAVLWSVVRAPAPPEPQPELEFTETSTEELDERLYDVTAFLVKARYMPDVRRARTEKAALLAERSTRRERPRPSLQNLLILDQGDGPTTLATAQTLFASYCALLQRALDKGDFESVRALGPVVLAKREEVLRLEEAVAAA